MITKKAKCGFRQKQNTLSSEVRYETSSEFYIAHKYTYNRSNYRDIENIREICRIDN